MPLVLDPLKDYDSSLDVPDPLICLAHGCDEECKEHRAYCEKHAEDEDNDALRDCGCEDCRAKEREWAKAVRAAERMREE